jgi:hypothetical protein
MISLCCAIWDSLTAGLIKLKTIYKKNTKRPRVCNELLWSSSADFGIVQGGILFVIVCCPFKTLITNTSLDITLYGTRKITLKADCFISSVWVLMEWLKISNQFPRFRRNILLPSKRPSRNPLDQGRRPCLRVRVQIVYNLQNKFFRVPMEILKSNEMSRSLPKLLLIIRLLLTHILITLFNKIIV